jgi:hypothetical protein
VVLLDEDRVEQPAAVAHAAAHPHRLLLECPQARRRLARVEDAHAGAGHRVHVARGERGDARQPAEEVQRHPLRREDRAGATGQLGEQPPVAPLALLSVRVPAQLRVDPLEHPLRHSQACRHAGRLLLDAGASPGAGLDHRRGGEVSFAHILGEGPVDQLEHQAEAGSRSRGIPAAA